MEREPHRSWGGSWDIPLYRRGTSDIDLVPSLHRAGRHPQPRNHGDLPREGQPGSRPQVLPHLRGFSAALEQDQDLEDLRMGHLRVLRSSHQGTFLSSGVYTRELYGPGVHSLIQTLRGLVLQGGGFMSV